MTEDERLELIAAALWGDYHSGIGLHDSMPLSQSRLLFANEDRETRLVYRAKARAVTEALEVTA